MGFLSDHVEAVRARLLAEPLDERALRSAVGGAPAPRSLAVALDEASARSGVAVIAEIKRASPSAGMIAAPDPVRQAAAYAAGGAAAISVLTEPEYFSGSLDDLRAIRAGQPAPVLRKDFLVHPAQVLEARAAGADSVLLIVGSLDDAELREMLAAARALGMEPLLETHGDGDLERALATDARIVGVNARDLESLEVDVDGARRRLSQIPVDRVRVLESGIGGRADVEVALDAGATGVLVGEALMRATDPAEAVRALLGWSR
jgi:indole-3-glycerol phosphate synthase